MKLDKVTLGIAVALITSGGIHLVLWLVSGQAWEGPLSLRKPALFGISGGMTVWSLGWVLASLSSHGWERVVSRLMAWALLAEVALISVQCWRGVPSHFNESTLLDTWIESAMLLLILLVTGWIAWLSWRVYGPLQQSPAMSLAIRIGMVWLFLSCLLGIGTTVLGKWNLMHGQPYEVWGRAGVLKFPHGIALHAIQFLPLGAWLAERWRAAQAYRIVQGLASAQLWLVVFALWQTLGGRARFDLDWVGILLLVAAAFSVGRLLRSRS